MSNIIFYYPVPLAKNPTKGSEVRPLRMIKAFRNCGFHVDVVAGYSEQRGRRMKDVRRAIREGREYDFMYAESSNVPVPLTDPHHLPIRPLQDLSFFRFLRRKQIPVGLFYRDVYWQVEEQQYEGSWFKHLGKRTFFWLEWWAFNRFVNHLFLPTQEIRQLLPTEWPVENCSALPPGCMARNVGAQPDESGPLELFYVGGVEPPYYDLRPLLELVHNLDEVHLTLCCRKPEWDEHREYYADIPFGNKVSIVHASSDKIGRYYRDADLVADVRNPDGYLRTALPVKTVEAIGYGVPMILRSGTSAAVFVDREGTGWTVDSLEEAHSLIEDLRNQRSRIQEKRNQVIAAQKRNSWGARARQAADTLRSICCSNGRDGQKLKQTSGEMRDIRQLH